MIRIRTNMECFVSNENVTGIHRKQQLQQSSNCPYPVTAKIPFKKFLHPRRDSDRRQITEKISLKFVNSVLSYPADKQTHKGKNITS